MSADRQEIARQLAAQMIGEATKGVPVHDELRQVAEGLALKIARDIVASDLPFLMVDKDRAIMCLTCGTVSHHPEDIKNRYCGACHKFHEG